MFVCVFVFVLAVGFTVDRIEDIDAVVAEAVKLNKEGKTVVIDAHITPHPPEKDRIAPIFLSSTRGII